MVAEHIAPARDPQRGAIRVGGHDLREFTCDSLLSNISMVFQNVYLFHDTIRANILFGKPDATEEEMIKAAKKARCHDFIMALPDGYDTVVGEGGGTLSGGEKQRIAIARMMLKNTPIIILDEATASRPSRTPTRSSSWQTAGSPSTARTPSSCSRTACTGASPPSASRLKAGASLPNNFRSRLKQGDLRPRRSPCFLFRLTPISPPLIMVDT